MSVYRTIGPLVLKSGGYYVIPSVFAFERPSVRPSVRLSVLHVYKM